MATKVKLRIEGENRSQQAFRSVNQNLSTMETSLRRASSVARGFVGILAAGAFARVVGNLIKTDDAASKLARSLGVSTEEISKLQFAAERSGVANRNLETGIRTLIQATADAQRGNNDYSRAFADLGIDAEKFARLPLTEKVEALADAFGELGDNASNRQDLAITVFGARGGLNFLNLLEGGSKGLRELNAEIERLGGVTTAEAGVQAEKAADALTNMSTAGKGLARTLGGTLLNPLAEVTNALSTLFSVVTNGIDISFTKAGQGIGTFLAGLGNGSSLDVVKAVMGDYTAADRMLERWDMMRGITTDVTGAQAGAAPVIAETTEKLKEQGDAASVTADALNKVRAAAAVPPPNSGPQPDKDRVVGEDFKGSLQGPEIPDGRIVGQEFKDRFEAGVTGVGFVVGDLINSGVQGGTEGAVDSFKAMIAAMLVEAAKLQVLKALFNIFPGGGFFAGAAGIPGLPGFDRGGIVGGPIGSKQLALVEGGETILPTHRDSFGGGGGVTYNIDATGAGAGVELKIEKAVRKAVALSEARRRDSQTRGRG